MLFSRSSFVSSDLRLKERNLAHGFVATLYQLHRLHFELPRVGFLLLGNLALL